MLVEDEMLAEDRMFVIVKERMLAEDRMLLED